jgi:hypothetical protein
MSEDLETGSAAVPTGLEELAVRMKGAAADVPGLEITPRKTRNSSSSTAAAPKGLAVQGEAIADFTQMFWNILTDSAKVDRVPPIQNRAFADALAAVLNKYGFASSKYAAEIALIVCCAFIITPRARQLARRRKSEKQELLAEGAEEDTMNEAS